MWAVVGLGNPGKKYRFTRHNAGFIFVRRLARMHGKRLRKRAYLSRIQSVREAGEKVLLVLPQTYMNRSGFAVKKMMEDGGVRAERMIIVYDDLDLPIGEIRIRREGRPGSHRGMQSIVESIESQVFPRIRIGIGLKAPEREAADYVLSEFSRDEKACFQKVLSDATDAMRLILQGRIDESMNRFNQKIKMN